MYMLSSICRLFFDVWLGGSRIQKRSLVPNTEKCKYIYTYIEAYFGEV